MSKRNENESTKEERAQDGRNWRRRRAVRQDRQPKDFTTSARRYESDRDDVPSGGTTRPRWS